MYPFSEIVVPTAEEVLELLQDPVKEALLEHPDHTAVAIIVRSEEQRQIGVQLTQEKADEFGNACLRQADRVIFLCLPGSNMPFGQVRVFDNYLTPEAFERRRRERTL